MTAAPCAAGFVKYGMPLAFTTTMLSWSLLEFPKVSTTQQGALVVLLTKVSPWGRSTQEALALHAMLQRECTISWSCQNIGVPFVVYVM